MLKRLRPRSLRARLALQYSCALILVALVLAGASRLAMAISLNHALDQGLRFRLIGMHHFIENNSQQGMKELSVKLSEMDSLGDLFQVFGSHAELIAQTDGLSRHDVSTLPPPDPGAGILFRNAGPHRFPLRMASQRFYVGNDSLIVEVAEPQIKYFNVLREFDSVLLVAVPIALAVAAFGGYWLSRRALTPVDRIIEEARAIHSHNLSARLFVPESGDELQRLAETLNQMLSRVEQSLLQMRQFTADASHELRAPMTLIYTSAQFALRRERSPDELKEALQKILREAKRCTALINDLLALARSDTAKKPLELVPTDLSAIVTEMVGEIRVLAADKGITVSTNLPAQPIKAALDEISFRRMLLILLDNAIKYTPSGGTVCASAKVEANNAIVAITDTGIGIPPDQLPYVFDRFWRADKVRSRDAGGSGLGLAIAKEIAISHAAELTAESSVGQGTTFTVKLPAVLSE